MVDKDTFMSTARKDFKWPYSKPFLAKPSQPSANTKPKNYFVKGPVDAYCHCDGHLYDPLMNRYLKLSEKEKLLHTELLDLNREMADVNNDILDHECDTYDEKMQSTYQVDYIKRGLPLTQYVELMPAVDAEGQIKPTTIELSNGYRDPTFFRYSTFIRPSIDAVPTFTFNATPATVISYNTTVTGRTEYQDTISNVGQSVIKSSQQYVEPLPTSRRRYGELTF